MATMTIRPSAAGGDKKDNYLANLQPNTNFGVSTVASCGFTVTKAGDKIFRPLLQFYLPTPLTPYNMTSVTLRLEVLGVGAASAEPAGLHRCTRPNWNETLSTWNDYNTGLPGVWTSPGGDWDFLQNPQTFNLPTSGGVFNITGNILLELAADAIVNRSRALILLMKRTTESGTQAGMAFNTADHASEGNRPSLIIEYRRVPGIEYDRDEVLLAENARTV